MSVQTFEYAENRSRFPLSELQKYQDQWVAFNSDGTEIVASSKDLVGLAELLNAAGVSPRDVYLERIDLDDDIFLGAAELM